MRHRSRPLLTLLAVLALAAAAACDDDGGGDGGGDRATRRATDNGGELVGLLGIDEGRCTDAGVTQGSSFRMVQPGGDPESGPYVPNQDSPCGDKTFTPLEPGTDGGLLAGEYQEQPDPPFAGPNQDGAADAITQPQGFFAILFAVATNPTDPQTEDGTRPPTITVADDGSLGGDLGAWAVAYGGQHFNQGAPKPDGSRPGGTNGPTGEYDAETGRYVLEWTSQIVGGPFDGFTGVWRLEGVFEEREA
jgi:hypothetical protein